MPNDSLVGPVKIDGQSLLTGIAGWPVGHSRSPLIHNYWFACHGINGAYVPLPIAPENFSKAVQGLAASGFRGINVTIPHKQAALAIADVVDASARSVGAANILSFQDGCIVASNSDSDGFLRALQASAPHWQAGNGPAVVLGAGGAARAVVAALIAQGAETIRIVNRSADHAQALQDHFQNEMELYSWGDAETCFKDAALLINTTSLGMQGQPKLEINLNKFPPGAVVNDLVYAPLETDLLAAARERGLVAVDGLGMLLHQAAIAFAIWFGVEPAVDDALRDYVLA